LNFGTQPLIAGSHIIRLERTDSTNNYAKSLLRQQVKTSEGTVIIAETQEHGRGQYGNSWNSESGLNLTFSIILFPKFLKPNEQFLLSQAVSLGIVEFIKTKIQLPVQIKWPNDILIEKKKVCGILIENSIMKDMVNESVVGIGLNVNQTKFPKDILNVVSLKEISKEDFQLEILLKELLVSIQKYYLKLIQGKLDFIKEMYSMNLFQYQVEAPYIFNNEIVKGKITGVNKLGQLEMSVNDELKTFNNKEVEYIF
jgi:BirA family transcriptional regulator, biotin operon repressor / biotin---[acetyl-CoA-carboxylase] ligase